MKKLSTHVLDVANGQNAARLKVEVQLIHAVTNIHSPIHTAHTAQNGRIDPLLSGTDFPAGQYRLYFYIGDYFATQGQGLSLPEPRFLDKVTIDIGVGNESLHLPLLITPWSYSVYRGC